MRGLLRFRRTYAGALMAMVLVAVVIGAIRDDDAADGAEGTPTPTPEVNVSPGPAASVSASPSVDASGSEPPYPTAVAPSAPQTDTDSGLPLVALSDLPPDAGETVELIEAGGPFPYADDGETFLNSAGLLPEREVGYYSVYTVDDPGSEGPTRRRIVSGAEGEFYWTDDLYESFRRIEQ